ncbi:MAG: tetratricopeptide repeat protein [Nitrososphaerota archaeon]|nr:tetratricopeptide repeat protein [Nitrososphaerota archaeon]MDG7026211.1 tetratricopeptide repeat protein [Nitrososphaerota archaeon]
MSEGRRLAAVMFTDMVGYTALTQSDESRAMELLDAHNRILRPLFPRFHGREVKSIGDSFLVEFDSALDALRCAVEIQEKVRGYNSTAGGGKGISIRIGVHLGDVVHRGGDVFGDAVNISSRIQPLAPPGGVCISRQVYDQVRNKFDLPLVSMGEKGLKGVEVPTEVFAVVMPWEKKDEVPPEGARRVAVLPFANMSPDPNDEFFADGITEEVISTVSRIEGTEVISRTSVMQYKKAPKPVREISRELGVGTVLEGSVRKAGNRLRVTVQMIDATKDRHVWAENYDRDLDDVFAIQSDIAAQVAGALKARLPGPAATSLRPPSLDAYTDYLRALQVMNEATPDALREATSLFEAALRKDPTFVKAYAELASICRIVGQFGDYDAFMRKAWTAAQKALELAPDSAEANAAMAEACMTRDMFEEARPYLQKAVSINPNLAACLRLLAEADAVLGDLGPAAESMRKAVSLDPLDLVNHMVLAEVYRVSGDMQGALAIYMRQKELHPRAPVVYSGLVSCYLQAKDYAKARAVAEEAVRVNPSMKEMGLLKGVVAGYSGDRAGAESALAAFLKEGNQFMNATAKLNFGVALRDFDLAFEGLSEQARLHSWFFLMRSDPLYADLVRDRRFAEFSRKVGMPAPA